MRILVVGPQFEDSFADNVAHAARDLGHEVEGSAFASLDSHWGVGRQLLRMVEARLIGDRPRPSDLALLRKARAFRPDLLLALTTDIHRDVLEELGPLCRGRRVLWWGDPPANSQRWGLVNPHWDVVYIKDPDAARKLGLVGIDARVMHEAMYPRWHRPLAEQSTDDVVVMGNAYGFRQALTVRLHRAGVPIALYGPKPPVWSEPDVLSLHRGVYVSREAKSRALGQGLAVLNSMSLAEGNSLNCRAFETAAAGALQLMEHRPVIAECFEPGKEILTFATWEELLGHIDRFRKHPAEAKPIRAAAAKRALAEHTYRHRLERILAECAG
jgi:spore maturation protein CgeB